MAAGAAQWRIQHHERPVMSNDVVSFVLLSHEQALRRRMDIAANNMANVNTIGFKREQAAFREEVERVRDAPVPDARNTSFVLDYGVVHDSSPGGFQPTGNPLDVMIEGPGYLSVDDGSGGTAYTRAGALHVLPDGKLGTTGGRPVFDGAGRAIDIPADQAAGLAIASDGTVSTNTGPLGRLAVTVFDELRVSSRGDGLSDGAGGRILTPPETRLKSRGLETSNVRPIVETAAMIEIQRAYQSSMDMSASLDAMRKQAIGRLSRID